MKKYTEELLISEGYEIKNALIESVDISMADHGCITLYITLKGKSWGVVYGGHCLGHGYLGAKDDFFDGSGEGMESIARIMNVVGVSRFNDMKGEYIRVATKGLGSSVNIIGNILNDEWFDIQSFFDDKLKEREDSE